MTGLQVWLHPSSRTKLAVSHQRSAISKTVNLQATDFTGYRLLSAGYCSYTLRLFGGRQPLCGIGVVSFMERTSIPAAASARTADSRPDPGPLTRTSTLRTP